MERSRLSVMLTSKRLQKLRDVANSQEKSMTRMIEDWVDRLPSPVEVEAKK